MRQLILVFVFLFGMSEVLSGQFDLEGVIFDKQHNEPIVGAQIALTESGEYTISDEQGYFKLYIEKESALVSINHIGYQTEFFEVTASTEYLKIGLSVFVDELQDIVITASSIREKLFNEPSNTAVLTQKDLSLGLDETIVPYLNQIPGVFMHSGALNTNRITIRGIGARSLFSTAKLKAYLNEIPLTTGDGETTIEDIDLAGIERVEVIKGPASSVYGAGLGGSINMSMMRSPYQKTTAESQFSVGSFGLIRSSNKVMHGSDKLNIYGQYSFTGNDGYRENNDYTRHNGVVNGQVFIGKQSVLSFLFQYVDLKAFIPSSIDSTDFAEDPRQAAFTWNKTKGFEDYQRTMGGLSFRQDINKNWIFNISGFSSYFDSYEVRPFNILDENSLRYGFRSTIRYQSNPTKLRYHILLGAEYFNEAYGWNTFENIDRLGEQGILLSENEELRTNVNIFTESKLSFSKRTFLKFGLNINRTRYKYTDLFDEDLIDFSGKYAFKTMASPRLALSHEINKQFNGFVQISHGFSPPSLEETLTPDGQINPDIQPERGWNFELGFKGKKIKERLDISASIYSMLIKDLLVARRTDDDQFVGLNAGKTLHDGLELQSSFSVLPNNENVSLTTMLGYTFSDFRFLDFVDGDADYRGNKLTGVPPHVLNVGAHFESEGIGLFLSGKYVASMPMRDNNSIYSDDYFIMDAKVSYNRTFFKRLDVQLFGGLRNLTNSTYAGMILVNAGSFGGNAPRYYYPGLPINWYTGLSIKYTFLPKALY